MSHKTRVGLVTLAALALHASTPAVGSAQPPLTACPTVIQLNNGINGVGGTDSFAKWNKTYTYSYDNTATSSTVINQGDAAFVAWQNASAAPYGSKVKWSKIAPNSGANIRVQAMPGTFQCFQKPPGTLCEGQVVFGSGGELTTATLYISNTMDVTRTLETMLHEIMHLLGAADGGGAGDVPFAVETQRRLS